MTTAADLGAVPLSGAQQHAALTQQPLFRAAIAVVLALLCTAVLIALSGKDPILAYRALFFGAFGSIDRAAFALNKTTPYLLAGIGIALCFRAKIINIGGEGQIAIGGLAATWAALAFPVANPAAAIALALAAATVGGALWAGVATVIHLSRRVHEVLVTLLLNFVALLIVGEALHGSLGEVGAGFPQSPLLPTTVWLPKLWPGTQLHIGIAIGVVIAVGAYLLLWRTTFGFAIRVAGASRPATLYAGFSVSGVTITVMLLAGALAGLAGGVEVLGVHYRLIEGFSYGFGFNAVAIALLGALQPLALIPAALFFGFLEAGALAMQRQVGVPSSLVAVIEGLTMLFILAAMASAERKAK
jgi:general nucleoside transport system permease protein